MTVATAPAPTTPAPTTNAAPSKTPSTPPPSVNGVKTDAKGQSDAVKHPVEGEVVSPRKLKIVVDGQEQELEESEIIKRAQKATGAEKRFEEAVKIRQQHDALVNALKDPKQLWQILSSPALGHDIKKIATEYLYENVVKPDSMSPEERERAKLAQEAEAARAELAEYKNREEQAKYQESVRQNLIALDKEFGEALASSGLPKSPEIVKRAAGYMSIALKNGARITAAEALSVVKEEMRESVKHFVNGLEGDALEGWLGAEIVEKLRLQSLKKIPGQVPAQTKTPDTTPSSVKAPNKFLTEKEWDQQFK